MISIIVSTYRIQYFEALNINIAESIGKVSYEIIKIDNPGVKSIAKAYNEGAAKAQYDNLLFIHEDIKFITKEWGIKLLTFLSLENTGIIGLAGATKKFRLPTGHETGIPNYGFMVVRHDINEKPRVYKSKTPIKVKTLDGVFLLMQKGVWNDIKFNENIKGYHFYDLDITLRASEKYYNYIANNIDIIHFSEGNFDNTWVKSSLKFHKGDYNFDSPTKIELVQTQRFWYNRLVKENITILNKLRFIKKMGLKRYSIKSAFIFLFSNFFK